MTRLLHRLLDLFSLSCALALLIVVMSTCHHPLANATVYDANGNKTRMIFRPVNQGQKPIIGDEIKRIYAHQPKHWPHPKSGTVKPKRP